MQTGKLKILYCLFFISGVTGLVYEIVWGRQLVLIFGSTTNSFIAVVSTFLGGLALGSLFAGRIADRLKPKSLILAYSALEFGVGLTAALTLFLLPLVRNIYIFFSDGSQVTFTLILIKLFLTSTILLIPTVLMGATLPILVKFLESQKMAVGKSVSVLYAFNTFGGAFGVIIAAYFLIELFGLSNTILIMACLNFIIALSARWLFFSHKYTLNEKIPLKTYKTNPYSVKTILAISAFTLSGLISLSYEILWTRILTPAVGTFVYAFASVLAIYLAGIAVGSLLYEKYSALFKSKSLAFAVTQLGIGTFAIISVLATHKFSLDNTFKLALIIFPAAIFMGLTFPSIINFINPKKFSGRVVGISYFGNTVGSIAGGFLAAYFFIRSLGSSQSVILLSIINLTIALIFIFYKAKQNLAWKLSISSTILLLVFASYLLIFKNERLLELRTDLKILESKFFNSRWAFAEDEAASVFAFVNENRREQGLFIDGVETTSKVKETKLMAHLPIAIHPDPKQILIIAFGMGSTYRSALTYDIPTDVVELVPSVPDFLDFFQPDAKGILNNPLGKIIINDGRNYAFLTSKNYDIVIIDPPPPFNAAGTTVLYSKEFYLDLAKKLKPNGIVSQWIYYYASREDDIGMALRSFTDVFPYVSVFRTQGGVGGLFLEGSFSKIRFTVANFQKYKSFKNTLKDIQEIDQKAELPDLIESIGNRQDLLRVAEKYAPVTDNYPRTEYFILRHFFKNSPILTETNAEDFIGKIKSQ